MARLRSGIGQRLEGRPGRQLWGLKNRGQHGFAAIQQFGEGKPYYRRQIALNRPRRWVLGPGWAQGFSGEGSRCGHGPADPLRAGRALMAADGVPGHGTGVANEGPAFVSKFLDIGTGKVQVRSGNP